jgi:hypothetical protein
VARRRAVAQDATRTALAIMRRQHRFSPEEAELDDECVVTWYLAEM